ncbi:MAG: aminotransferase class V-fold PLP-dependent enzyme [Patescibacteria group bacterium]
MQDRLIYLDHAATTPTDARVVDAMRPFMTDVFGNPSSLHQLGVRAQTAVMEARESIAKIINAHADEIVFTSGGTESDNLAIVGIVGHQNADDRLPHVVTSAIEHHAVLETLKYLEKTGAIALTVVPVDRQGIVDPKTVLAAMTQDTVLVSIMTANNEIGTIQPIAEIGRAILSWRKEHASTFPLFHSDACQAAGVLDLNVEKSHVDLLTISGSKIYGPKGVGALFVRRGVKLAPMVRGGGQERNLRSGTENVPGIVGMAKALELLEEGREAENVRLTTLRDRLIEGLLRLPKTFLNGHATERLPNNANVTFLDMEGEAAVLYLDAKGICSSTGSACASTSLDPSHVILALGVSYEAAHGSVRFTLGHSTTEKDVDFVIEIMPEIVEHLRKMSPVKVSEKYYV